MPTCIFRNVGLLSKISPKHANTDLVDASFARIRVPNVTNK